MAGWSVRSGWRECKEWLEGVLGVFGVLCVAGGSVKSGWREC